MSQNVLDGVLHSAKLVAGNAYAPYSKFKVGAAVLFDETPTYFYGTNVENASYGLTLCAERNAIFTGVAAGLRKLRCVVVAVAKNTPLSTAFVPCGACLQVIAEFGNPETDIVIEGLGAFKLKDLLPHAFKL